MANNRLYLVDFCRHRQLTRFDRELDPMPAPLDQDQNALVGGTAVGCDLAVSHLSGSTGSVLTRVRHDTGEVKAELLPVGNGDLIDRPGPSAWLQRAPAGLLTGSIPAPYPAGRIQRDYTVSLSGIPWLADQGLIGFAPTLPGLRRVGHGNELSLLRTAIVANNAELLTQNKVKALHRHRLYARVGVQGDDKSPSSLRYVAESAIFRWPTVYEPGATKRTFFAFSGSAGGGTRSLALVVDITLWPVFPVLTGLAGQPWTATVVNGPGQSRSYQIVELEDRVVPDFGGSIGLAANLESLRSGCYLYGKITQEGPLSPVVTLNGQSLLPLFSGYAVPTPQDDGRPITTQYDTVAVIEPRNIPSWEVICSGHGFSEFGVADPLNVGKLTFGDTPIPGYLYEGIFRFVYRDVTV